MATIVYQGLHTCLESQLAESRTLRLKLSSSKPHSFYQSIESLDSKSCFFDSKFYNNPKGVSEYHKSFIEEETCKKPISHIANNSSSMNLDFNTSMEKQKQPVYVHPLEKRSSKISFELCTENLGSETGSNEVINDVFALSTSETTSNGSGGFLTKLRREQQQQQSSCFRKASKLNGIPPPLTTIRGSESIKITSHRENGRLVMNAVQAPSMRTCFRAERSNGRLRLSFWNDDATDFSDEAEYTENDIVNHNDDVGEEEVDEIDGNSLDHSSETNGIIIGKSESRRRRCNDDEQLYEKKKLLNRESFWVVAASS